MSKFSNQTITCIFCTESKLSSEEHIFPENIGGKISIHNVCKDCNNLLGSEVDSELNRHRHIYDAYRKIQTSEQIPLSFKFIDAFVKKETGETIKISKNSAENKIIPTKLNSDVLVTDGEDSTTIINIIKKEAKKRSISVYEINNIVSKYLNWEKSKLNGQEYIIESIALRIVYNETSNVKKTLMNGETPHRFICKALVEIVA